MSEPDLKDLHVKWLAEIELYEREAEPWVSRSKKIIKLYKDESNNQGKRKRFNVLWSNVQTMKPALYARDPNPEVERRHKDRDPVGRAASEVLQRCVSYTIACQDFGQIMRQCVEDRLLPARGQVWVRYEPELEGEQLMYEKAAVDYVYWEDFGHSIARTWAEVPCVWHRSYMSRAQLIKRFGEEKGKQIPLDHVPKGLKDEKIGEQVKKACIYEGWEKDGGVWFLSKSYPELIEYRDTPPLDLTGTFPCPRPLYGTVTNDSLIPVPDYALYQTQAQELEDLTARIDRLQKGLKLVGCYDSSQAALGNILTGDENKLVPVQNWAQFAEKGGLDGAIVWLPIKEVAETLIALYESRDKAKQDLYEITGIADIIRGNSEPSETATAQQIKGRFAVLRISDGQSDVQRFACDVIRLLAEIIAENFQLETIKQISGYQLLTQEEKQQLQANPEAMQQALQQDPKLAELMEQPTWEEVHALLSNQVLREFRVDVETDSTIRTDEDADRASRSEFLTAAGGFLNQAVQAGQAVPAIAPLLGELLMFGVRSFKAGRTMEPAFEAAMKKLQQAASQPQQDPEMAKVQAQTQLEREKAQITAQLEQQKMQIAAQQEQAVQAAQAQQEMQRQQVEDQRAERDAQRQAELERFKAQLQVDADLQKAQAERETAIIIERLKIESAERIAQMNARVKLEGDAMKAQAQEHMADKQAEHESFEADKDRQSAEKLAAKKAAKSDA
jgi:hypothetical protein